jgi:hypothetical protein
VVEATGGTITFSFFSTLEFVELVVVVVFLTVVFSTVVVIGYL